VNLLDAFVSRTVGTATAAASEAASARAAAAWEQYKPLAGLGVFLAVTLYVFYFLPRFKLPWQKAS
jgi:hypothetical protein